MHAAVQLLLTKKPAWRPVCLPWPAACLPACLPGCCLLQFMKMDVEGYEQQVLQGATALLQKHNVW
jgi:hypothetical protein